MSLAWLLLPPAVFGADTAIDSTALPNPSPAPIQEVLSTAESDSIRVIGSARVYSFPESTSPVLGIVEPGSSFLRIDVHEDWLWIVYEGMPAWIRAAEAFAAAELPTPPDGAVNQGADSMADIVRAAIHAHPVMPATAVSLAVIIAALLIALSRHLRAKSRFRERRSGKRALMVTKRVTTVECGGGRGTRSLSRCFEEVGFRVYETSRLGSLAGRLGRVAPHVLAVDVAVDPHAVSKVERILRRKRSWREALVIFYNVAGMPDASSRRAVGLLPHAWTLGRRITDQRLFELLSPLVEAGATTDASPVPFPQPGAEALQGRIIDDSLQEVFAFMEIGRKTGCLLVETNRPHGLVYFQEGRIVSASTKQSQGFDAAMELLAIRRGIFRFVADKRPEALTCSLSVSGVLLEHAKKVDEAAKRSGHGPVGFYIAFDKTGAAIEG